MTYPATVAPLLLQNCGNYHANGAAFGGVALGSYAQMKTVATCWAPSTTRPATRPMPKGGAPLLACDRAKLRLWVAAGASNT